VSNWLFNLKTDYGYLLSCFLEKFMSKNLNIKYPATPVILSTSIPHYYQYVRHPQVLQ